LRLKPAHKLYFRLGAKQYAQGTHVGEVAIRCRGFRIPVRPAACAGTENDGHDYEKWDASEAEHHDHKRGATGVP